MKELSREIPTRRKLAVTAALVPVLFLAGCGGGSDSGSSSGTPVTGSPSGVSEGVVYDGYLRDALVCVDENLNKACDESEPNTTTKKGGAFSLQGLTESQLQLPIVVQSTAETIDEDTGAAVGTELKFSAPAGSKAVSAFSTIIQSRIERAIAGGSTASLADLKAQASAGLAAELGVTGTDLTNYDPIAVKKRAEADEVSRGHAAKLHLVNQVLSQVIITLNPQAAASSNGNLAGAFGALVKKLDVVDIKAAVDRDTVGLALADLITAVAGQVVTVTPTQPPTNEEIREQVEEYLVVMEAILDVIRENPKPTGATGGSF